MTFSTGVPPSESRNTPTPTSILSGRGSALQSAISARSESLWTGGRSASPLGLAAVSVSMAKRLAKSGVVIHRDAIAERHRLAGQHVTARHLLVGEAVTCGHLDLAFRDFRPARRAHARLASEGRGQPGSTGTVEDITSGERHFASAAVQRDRNRHAFRLR